MRIVERDGLVGRLRAAVQAARAGDGRMILVSGEAGAGKTAVVREVVADVPALWGFCEPLGTPRPLGPFRDIGRQLSPPPGALDVVAIGERMLDEVRTGDLVLVVEDAHWIDAASADLLRFVGRRIGSSGGTLLLTFRDELDADHPLRSVLGDLATAAAVLRVDVPPLSVAAVTELVAGTALDPREAHRLTGGNAFLVSQLAADPGRTDGVAATVRDSVMTRVGRLPAPARDLVELLSVVPGRVGADLLGEDWSQLDGPAVAGLVRVDGSVVEFRHELVRMAVEEQLPPGRRRRLHAEVLRRLTDLGGAEPAEVAFHARGAHDVRRALAGERAAAERAAALGSHREAAAHYRRAIADAGPVAAPLDLARLELALSQQEFWTARDEPALEAARRAVELCPPESDPRLRSAALRWLSRLTPEQEQAHRLAAEAVDMAEQLGPSAELAAAYAHRATERMLARDLAPAVAWSARAIQLATEVGDTESLVVALQVLGSAELLRGEDSGAAHLRRAIDLARAAGLDGERGRAYANLVSGAGEGRLYPVADAVVGEATGYFVSRDLDAYAGYTRAWHARCLFELGRWPQAAAEADRALARGAAGAAVVTVLTARYVQGRMAVRRGEDAGALDEAGRIAAVTGSLQRIGPVAAARAEAAWLAGRTGDVPGLAAAYELAVERASPWAAGELGLWLWRHGGLDRLPATAAAPYRLHVDGDPVAAGHAWLRIGCPYEAADAWADSSDEEAVRSALGTFTRLGAGPGRQRAARRLRELGVRTVPRGPRASTVEDPDGLTAREQEVLRWLRAGHTDAEIAAGLHLSVRTVGHHVSAVLRKTGARSRRDLQARAAGPAEG